MLVLASLVLGFAMFDALSEYVVVWLHPMPRRLCLDVTTWEASPDVGLLHVHPPISYSVRWYACHACLHHPVAFYASLYACLHVHAWVLLASVSSMLQHIAVMDIRSKSTFVPHKHHLLFSFLLCLFVYLFLCMFACFLVCLCILLVLSLATCYACHVYHVYLFYAPFICSLFLFLPLLVCWFLVFAFACTHVEQGRMELRCDLPGTSKKGEDASM